MLTYIKYIKDYKIFILTTFQETYNIISYTLRTNNLSKIKSFLRVKRALKEEVLKNMFNYFYW